MRRFFAVILCVSLLLVPVRAEGEEKYVALTFDDGPSGRFTRALLEGLRQRHARASFFLCGYRVELYPREALQILEEGHEIGIHGFSHDPMDPMTEDQITDQIRATARLLPQYAHPVFLRPPGGLTCDALRAAAKRDGLSVLSWSVDPQDWAIRDPEAIVDTVVSRVRDGDVVLLHDMSDSSVEAALRIVDILSKRGFRFVTVTELAQIKGHTLKPGKEYYRFS